MFPILTESIALFLTSQDLEFEFQLLLHLHGFQRYKKEEFSMKFQGMIIHEPAINHYEHSSLISTLRKLFGVENPLTKRLYIYAPFWHPQRWMGCIIWRHIFASWFSKNWLSSFSFQFSVEKSRKTNEQPNYWSSGLFRELCLMFREACCKLHRVWLKILWDIVNFKLSSKR